MMKVMNDILVQEKESLLHIYLPTYLPTYLSMSDKMKGFHSGDTNGSFGRKDHRSTSSPLVIMMKKRITPIIIPFFSSILENGVIMLLLLLLLLMMLKIVVVMSTKHGPEHFPNISSHGSIGFRTISGC